MEKLPAELLFHICAYLEVGDLVNLLATSKQLRAVARDGDLWKSLCFSSTSLDPSFLWSLRKFSYQDIGADGESSNDDREGSHANYNDEPFYVSASRDATRARAIANWDPSYPEERVDWYQEYIARHGPISMNWLQIPILKGSGYQTVPESKGLALYTSTNDQRVVSPLDDGSICLWDISSAKGSFSSARGAVIERSAPNLISTDGKGSGHELTKSRMTSTGVVECISVDGFRQKAYVAVQRGLNEVDLPTMRISSHKSYPFSISALSEVGGGMPLTVGTNLTLHIHDHRQQDNGRDTSDVLRVDSWTTSSVSASKASVVRKLLSGEVEAHYATLFQPGPLSILHLNPSGAASYDKGEIYVAGRFPSVLVYDRRTFPRLRGTLHSGARLSSMVSLPYSFKLLETELMRHNQLSIRQVESTKSSPGDRLIACGEYNGKGSLEIYGLDAEREVADSDDPPQAGLGQNSSFKNRVSASPSKLLSIAKHGTRLVMADGDGNLRWMERNGSSFVRAWNLNYQDQPTDGRQFAFSHDPNMNDVARKILPTANAIGSIHPDQNEILVWTGERIGLLGFTRQPQFGGDLDLIAGDELQATTEVEHQHQYEQAIRRTLERQADEVQWMKRFGRMG